MKLGLLFEMQPPRPWTKRSEHRQRHEAIDEIELVDKLGCDYIWAN
ncbi:hypothetical protein N9F34_00485 [Alphaproteobacteria bacterium]|nr:hypothetical protein [Alphaproteobacteria bacterium]